MRKRWDAKPKPEPTGFAACIAVLIDFCTGADEADLNAGLDLLREKVWEFRLAGQERERQERKQRRIDEEAEAAAFVPDEAELLRLDALVLPVQHGQAGLEAYRRTELWEGVRAIVIAGHRRCEECKQWRKTLQVHHKHYDFIGREHRHLDCLEALCARCHIKRHEIEPIPKQAEKESPASTSNPFS